VFERFDERARQVVVLAQDESRTLKHNYVGTEHLLLGLLREDEGVAARVLGSLDVTFEEVRAQIVRVVGHGDEVTSDQIPFTRRATKVLELSMRQALSLGDEHIETEHILLAIVAESEGVAARILLDFDADARSVCGDVMESIRGIGPSERARRKPSEPMEASRAVAYSQMGSRPSTMHLSREASLGGRARWASLADRAHLWIGMLLGALLFGLGLLVGRLIWG
jgi:ATP-dependent Clp protease ATP-binding subunit ClpC